MEIPTRAEAAGLHIDLGEMRRQRGWFLALGLIMLAAGISAVVFPFMATLAVAVSIGIVLVVAGIAQFVHAFSVRKWRGFLLTLLSGLLSLVVGSLVLIYPGTGILSLTLLVGTFLLAGGALKALLAFRLRPLAGWPWLLFSGCLAMLLGVLVVWMWPSAAGWVLGLLVGIDLVFSGWWLLTLSAALWRSDAASSRGSEHLSADLYQAPR